MDGSMGSMARDDRSADRDVDRDADRRDADLRDAGGRFAPGRSGNPAGRPKGARNRRSVLLEMLEEGEEGRSAREVLDMAHGGDRVAARLVFERLFPKPRGRAIELDLPLGASAAAALAAFDAMLAAMADGEITLDEAAQIARLLETRRRLLAECRAEGRHAEAPVAAAAPASAGAAGPSQAPAPALRQSPRPGRPVPPVPPPAPSRPPAGAPPAACFPPVNSGAAAARERPPGARAA